MACPALVHVDPAGTNLFHKRCIAKYFWWDLASLKGYGLMLTAWTPVYLLRMR